MNNIESEFGCKLLVRSHSGITLTPKGEQLYEHVAIAIEQLTKEKVKSFQINLRTWTIYQLV